MADKLAGKLDATFVATEPAACPTLTRGEFAYDFGDTGEMTPIVPMYTLGHTFVPAPVHAGGLRYHGDAPSLSALVKHGLMEARAYTQNQVFEAGVQFAKAQGIVPAPEPNHAIRAVIDEAIRPGRPARRRSSCSTSVDTATSTCRPTTTSWRGAFRRSSSRKRRWPTV